MKKRFTEQIRETLEQGVRIYGSSYKLAKACDVQLSTLGRWLEGTPPRSADVEKVMDVLGARIVLPDEKQAEYDFIPKIAAKAGAGALSLETDGYEVARYAFRKDFLGMKGISSKNAVLLDVTGDSMRPLLSPGDTVLIDLSNKTIVDGGIYLVTLYENLLIKQVVLAPNHIILHSLNAPDIPVQPHEMDSFQLHGRMRWAARMFD